MVANATSVFLQFFRKNDSFCFFAFFLKFGYVIKTPEIFIIYFYNTAEKIIHIFLVNLID